MLLSKQSVIIQLLNLTEGKVMTWDELYGQDSQPVWENINQFVNNDLYKELCTSLEREYKVLPKIEYSNCSAQRGWNIKYKKSGKSLCTIYPMEGYFIALVVIGAKETEETEFIMPTCTEYVRNLYLQTPFLLGGRWLMINVTDRHILDDVLKLIGIRSHKTK